MALAKILKQVMCLLKYLMTQELIQTPRGNNLNILSLTKTETSPLSTSTAVTTAQHLLHASFYFQNRNTKTQCTFSAALSRQFYL